MRIDREREEQREREKKRGREKHRDGDKGCAPDEVLEECLGEFVLVLVVHHLCLAVHL